MSELEIENERIVTQFCLDWATRDVNLLADYLADDVVYHAEALMVSPGVSWLGPIRHASLTRAVSKFRRVALILPKLVSSGLPLRLFTLSLMPLSSSADVPL